MSAPGLLDRGTSAFRSSRDASALVVVVLAGMVGALWTVSPGAAVVLALVPALLLLMPRPQTSALLGVGLLPFFADVMRSAPVKVSLSDALLAFALLAGLFIGERQHWRPLTAMIPLVATYGGVLLLAVVAHVDVPAVISAAQRMQIIVVPLIVGAVLLRGRTLRRALDLYVLVSALLGIAWTAEVIPPALEFQKNPVGQYLAGALLTVAADPTRRGRLLAIPPLAIGLLATESRGSLLGLLFGLAVLVLARPGADKLRTAALLVPFLLVLGLVYVNLPDDVQQRTSTISGGEGSEGQYTIELRTAYRQDALEIIRQHPLTGVGIGNYLAGNTAEDTLTDDPHNVLLLEAGEGGIPLVCALLVLIGGSCVLLWRRRTQTRLASLALAVQASTIGHGLVDVYWVRGTPVLGWLLVGVALADAERKRQAAAAP